MLKQGCIFLFSSPKESRQTVSYSALVLDAAQRSALAVTRSLGRAGLSVTTTDAVAQSLAGCSRHSAHYLQSPSPEQEPQVFLRWLADLLEECHFDLVLPVTEITSQLILMHRDRLPNLTLPFADYDTVMALADKGRLMALAQQLDIPYPQTRWCASARDLKWGAIEYPAVIKPCQSKIYLGDRWLATRVRVVHTEAELKRELAVSAYLQDHPFMLQAFIPGRGAGVFCLYNRGEPAAFFAHRRLREKPPEGGVSVLSESAPVDPQMQDYAQRLLAEVSWHGAAMVEFRVSPEGKPYLMEVNTRFWGSLQLAIDAGVDFPYLLWQVHQGQSPGQVDHYRLGQRLRWLLGDLDGLYLYLKGRYTLGQKTRRLLQFFTPRLHHCRHEINRWGDLGPARYELKLYLKQLMGQ